LNNREEQVRLQQERELQQQHELMWQQQQWQQQQQTGVWGSVMPAAPPYYSDPPPPYPGLEGGVGGLQEVLVFPHVGGEGVDGGGEGGELEAGVDDDVTPRVSPRGEGGEGGGGSEGGEEDEDSTSEKSWEAEEEAVTCAICNETKAVVSCEQCGCVLCGNCSNNIHKQTISKHIVLPLGVRAQTGNRGRS